MRIYMDTSALAKLIVAENESLSLLRCEQAEVGEDLRRPCAGRSVGDPEESGCVAGRARGLDRLNAQAVSVGLLGSFTTAQLHSQRSGRQSSTPRRRGQRCTC
jgi:hypothetical protein